MSSLFGSLNQPQGNPTTAASASPFPASTSGGGLFSGLGKAPSTSSNTGGMFGGLGLGSGAAASQPSGSLFGQSATTSAPSGGGLFGALGGGNTATSTSQTTGGGLFGQTTSTPSGGGLFGGLGGGSAATSQPGGGPASGGLFGNLGGGNAASQSTGLFGQQQSTTPAAGNSLFGASQVQQQNGASTLGLGQSQQGGSTSYFDSILDRSRKRNHAESTPEDLPQLQLGLGDLRQRIKRLAPGNQDRTSDGRAHYLLAASGVDPGAAVRDLNQFGVSGRAERTQPQENNDADVEGYLANLQTQTTLSMISDGLARSVQDFDTFLEDNVAMEWDAQRKRIYQHFGITPKVSGNERSSFAISAAESQSGFGRSRRSKAAAAATSRAPNGGVSESKFGRSNMQKSVIGAAGPVGSGHQPLFADVEKQMESHGVAVLGPHDRFQRDKELRFTEKVKTLNSSRLQKRAYPICAEFASVVRQSGEHFSAELVRSYSALAEIVGENPEVTSLADPNAVKERQYAKAYLDEPNSESNRAVRKRILRGGARCLEKLKFEEMEEFIAKNPREANLGGIPNVISKVKAYVRLQATRKNLASDNADLQQLDNEYVWALIFNLIRTGHVHEAVDYVATNATAFRAIDRNFASYITDYADNPNRKLRQDLQERINNEYNQRLRIAPENSIDPYRMACYKIIGRCDLKNRQLEGIKLAGLQDFMWLQLALAREIDRVNESASEAYGLQEAQDLIREIGNRHFSTKGSASDVGSSWGAFVLYQMVFGLFEEAVSYLYTYSYVDGVHLAIALDFYGLLRVSDPNKDDFLSTTTTLRNQVNFGRMLGYYTRDFRAADVGGAVDYLVLICLNKDLPGQLGASQVQLCHEALRELVLESREIALLLGDIRGDGQRMKGVIEERMALIGLSETDDFMRAITIQAASIADDNGRTTDAVLLYHLAGEFDNVMAIVTRSLSEAINIPIGHEQMRLQALKPRLFEESRQREIVEPTLSLTSVEDPAVLAHTMLHVYSSNHMFSSRVKEANKTACHTLLRMHDAKSYVESSQWTTALDVSFLQPNSINSH